MEPRKYVGIFSLLLAFCLVKPTDQQDRSQRSVQGEQPRIITQDGHLIFQTGINHNITFKSAGSGFVNIDGENFKSIVSTVKENRQKINDIQGEGTDSSSGSLGNRVSAVEQSLQSLTPTGEVLAQLEQLRTQLQQLTTTVAALTSGSSSSSGTLVSRVTQLETQMQRVRRRLRANECDSNPCMHGATCIDLYNSYSCRCTAQWQGQRCDTDVNECRTLAGTDLGCQNGATCLNTAGGFSCQCTTNWHGLRCTESHDDCTGASSQALCGHGACVNVPRTNPGQAKYRCICDEGWQKSGSSPACVDDVDECNGQRYPCSTNPRAPCVNVPGSFRCGNCPRGYTGNGFVCTDINECEINNGGCSLAPRVPCTNSLGSFTCGTCPSGYQGNGVACRYVGICHDSNGGCHPLATCRLVPGFQQRMCTCPTGYMGSGVGPGGCVQHSTGPSVYCTNNPCVHGRCSDAGQTYRCTCDGGWTGTNCNQQTTQTPCALNPCQNGGTCVPSGSQYTCQCAQSFTGFNCERQQQNCGGRLPGTSGTFRYPVATGQQYPHGVTCVWIISTLPTQMIMLQFTEFKLEEHDDCEYDSVEVRDGDSASDHLIGKYCGNQRPNGNGLINSTHSQLYIKFQSDSSGSADGFQVVWNSAAPVCGGRLRGQDHGVITSPGYPGNYAHNRDCVWTIRVSYGKKIQLTLGQIHMESHDNCSYDFLSVKDGFSSRSNELGRYCSTMTPHPILTSGPYAYVYFHSDDSNNDRGFQLHYSAIPVTAGCGGTLTEDHGVLISPNYPNAYPSNVECVWTISVASTDVITMTFTNLDLEANRNCRYDFVELRDGNDINAPFVGRYCGNQTQLPAPYVSSGGALWIKFRSDGSTANAGFRATWTVVCGGLFTETTGQLQSPFFPNVYPNDKECVYVIQQEQGMIIQLTFVTFDIEASTSGCRFDYLEVHNGASADSPQIGRYCGSQTPSVITSAGNALWLKFKTDGSRQNHGFRATYTTSAGGSSGSGGTGSSCGGTLTGSTGTFRSPSHPSNYPHGVDCRWYITVQSGLAIRLSFSTFNIESHRTCTYDSVSVYDNYTVSANSLLGKFCGRDPPTGITSTDNVMTIRFKTDSSVSREGFVASYISLNTSSICGGELRAESGVISSPNYPNQYPHGRSCEWIIVMPPGKQVRLNITDFRMESHPHCNYDKLEIRNGGYASSPLIGKYCGTTIDNIIVSHSNRLFLRMTSDGSGSERGFQIYYDGALSGCGGDLTAPSGTIVTPNYPHSYHHRAECLWSIIAAHGSTIQLTFIAFNLESSSSSDCRWDYLQVNDGRTNHEIQRFCGSTIPPPFTTTGNGVNLKFHSDSSSSSSGFHLSYHALCNSRLSQHQGIVESPGFPQNYPPNQDCTWVIEATLGNTVNASFSHFEVEGRSNCQYDYMELHDGETLSTPLIGRFCGTNLPANVATSSRYLFIKFHSDSSRQSSGFRLEYIMNGCGGLFNLQPSGEIKSLNYPNHYPAHRECVWYINTAPSSRIQLNITDIDLEEVQNCTFDSLQIFGGPDDTAPRLANLCGTKQTASVLTSTGRHMVVKFKADSGRNGRGFRAIFTQVTGGCGGNYSMENGIITSENYPSRYPHNVDCEYLLTVAHPHPVVFTFIDFQLEGSSSSRCYYDYVQLFDGASRSDTELAKKCGSSLPDPHIYQSSSNQMLVRFRADGSVNRRGFKATYSTGCGGSIDAEQDGAIVSPNYPNKYGALHNCTWIIRAQHSGDRITLTFTDMDIEGDGLNCTHDYIQLFNGEDVAAGEIGNYCGRHVPPSVTSVGTALTLYFHTDASYMRRGFRAVYSKSSSACGGEFQAEHGTFVSPNYPDSYPVNMECVWVFRASPGNQVMISFSFFNLEQDQFCNSDHVEIREGGHSGTILGRYCGNQIPNNITAGHELWVKFRSNENVPGQGFMAHFSSLYGGELNQDSGQLASPLYPRDFGPNENHAWVITVGVGKQISVTFDTIDMEPGTTPTTCEFDYIKFRDGSQADSPVIGVYCGFALPAPFTSPGNQLRVEFHSDYSMQSQGFLFSWQAVEPTPVTPPPNTTTGGSTRCGGDIIVSSSIQSLESPGFPFGYAHRLNCVWNLITDQYHRIAFTFTDMDLERNSACSYDSVGIYDVNYAGRQGRRLIGNQKYCGSHAPANTIYSASSSVQVVFTTDGSVNRTGFSGNFSAVCGGEVHSSIGQLQSPGYPNAYPANTNCTWKLVVDPGRAISITFNQFNLRQTTACSGDYVQLLNGHDQSSPPFGQPPFCGNRVPSLPGHTSDNAAIVNFVTDGTGSAPGFQLTFREYIEGCGGHLRLTDQITLGEVTSPDYPSNYLHNMNCIWIITAPANERIHLNFIESFNIEPHSNCHFDYVEARDGGTSNALLIGRVCGKTLPSSFTSTGHVMYLHFRTDSSVTRIGFKAEYKIATCGGTINAARGTLESPGYPTQYPNNLDCEWRVIGPTGHFLIFTFESFRLQYNRNCSLTDYLQIREFNSTGADVATRCGIKSVSRSDMRIETSDSFAYVHFHSDNAGPTSNTGFRMNFEASIEECGGEVTTATGTITTPNYPGLYAHRRRCLWRIRVPEGRRVTLAFNEFDMESSNHCNYDYVLVFSGALEQWYHNAPIGKYCGTQNPGTLQSTGNTMTLLFVTDGSLSGRGFSASYHSNEAAVCGGTINQAMGPGSISSPGYEGSGSYNNSQQCLWRMQSAINSSVIFKFNNISIERHGNCVWDFLEIREGTDESAPILDRYCGNLTMITAPIVSPSPNLFIIFKSDILVNAGGFSLNYTFADCGGLRTAPQGVLSSPNFPSSYDTSTSCAWKIMAPEGQQILLNFTDLDVESSPNCTKDYINILSGGLASSPTLQHYCGNQIPAQIRSFSNELRIEFHSDATTVGSGFRIQYTFDSTGCGGTVIAMNGQISSPNWPQLYSFNTECLWDVQVPNGYHLNFTFVAPFGLEVQQPCRDEYVKISEQTPSHLARTVTNYCGNQMPTDNIELLSNKATVKFRSNDRNNFQGFGLNFTAECGGNYTADTGTIVSPGYPQHYDNNLRCNYTIQTGSQHYIYLTFKPDHFFIEGQNTKPNTDHLLNNWVDSDLTTSAPTTETVTSAESNATNSPFESLEKLVDISNGRFWCRHDYVQVYSGDDSSARRLGKYCGDRAPQTVGSTGSMFIEFVTDGDHTDRGWIATYEVNECGGEFDGEDGVIHSPSHPRKYLHSTNCTWLITVPTNKIVRLKFTNFSLEAHPRCVFDAVNIYDGDSLGDRLIGSFCGLAIPPMILSSGRSLLAQFVTDRSVQRDGFRAVYTATLGPNQGCGGFLNSSSGSLASVDFDSNGQYESNLDCIWSIVVPSNHIVKLHFNSLSLEDGSTCTDHDYVEVHDGNSALDPLVGTFCGTQIPPDITATTNSLYVRFVSDDAINLAGFSASFSSENRLCGGSRVATSELQTLTSPSYPQAYPASVSCRWTLDAPEDEEIYIKFTDFAMEQSDTCSADYFEIREVQNPVVAHRSLHYCGMSTPPVYYSTHRTITLNMVSNARIAARGFSLQYSTTSCNRTYTGTSGRVTSPHYPGKYPVNSQCSSIISAPIGTVLSLFFTYFQMETHRNCNYDFLRIRDGDNSSAPILTTVCGGRLPNPVFATGNTVFMEFVTDTSVTFKGYDLTYIASSQPCGGRLNMMSGSFASPNYPGNYSQNVRCEWILEVPPRFHVNLTFVNMDIDEHNDCANNNVAVYNGQTATSGIVGTYCGDDIPATYRSTANKLLVVFSANVNNTGTGFQARFNATSHV